MKNVVIDGITYQAQEIMLSFSCVDLKNLDIISKSDPQLFVFDAKHPRSEIGRTEVVKDSLNPHFSKSIIITYIFEIQQHIEIEVRDIDIGEKYEILGNAKLTLSSFLGGWKNPFHVKLHDSAGNQLKKSEVIINYSQVPVDLSLWQFQSQVENIIPPGGFLQMLLCGANFEEYYLKFYLDFTNQDHPNGITNECVAIHTTETISSSSNSPMKTFEIDSFKLNRSNDNLKIFVDLMEKRAISEDKIIATTHFNSTDLIDSKKYFWYFMKDGKKCGVLSFPKWNNRPKFGILNFIEMGVKISPILGVDFTGSNGDPSIPNSLHYYGNAPNQYQQSIISTLKIVLDYADSDQVLSG